MAPSDSQPQKCSECGIAASAIADWTAHTAWHAGSDRAELRDETAPTASWLDDVARASLAAAQSKFGSQMPTVEPIPAVPAPPTEPTPSSLPDPRTEPTISVKRAGEILGVGRSAAYAAVSQGQIPTIQVGARLVVPTAALLRILEGLPPATE